MIYLDSFVESITMVCRQVGEGICPFLQVGRAGNDHRLGMGAGWALDDINKISPGTLGRSWHSPLQRHSSGYGIEQKESEFWLSWVVLDKSLPPCTSVFLTDKGGEY